MRPIFVECAHCKYVPFILPSFLTTRGLCTAFSPLPLGLIVFGDPKWQFSKTLHTPLDVYDVRVYRLEGLQPKWQIQPVLI